MRLSHLRKHPKTYIRRNGYFPNQLAYQGMIDNAGSYGAH